MNQAISVELWFFLVSILSGAILLAVYDLFRVLRRLIKHDSIIIALEDLLFWIGASLYIFSMMFRENNGIIRGFSIMGMIIGMVLYHFVLSEQIVGLITKLIRMLLRPLVIICRKIKAIIRIIIRKIRRIVKFIAGRLKKRLESVKMALNKRRQAAIAVRCKRDAKKLLRKKKEQELKQAKKKSRNKTSVKQPYTKDNTGVTRPVASIEKISEKDWHR